MPRTRNRLIAAARRSMLQRAELHRRLDVAKAALKPGALVARGKYRVGEKADDFALAVRQEFRDNRLPIALAAVAGIMSGVVVQIRPTMGHDLLLPLFAAAILGGIGSVPGAMLAGLIVGLAEALTVQLIGAEWRAAVSFVILVAVLLLRPQGIFGKVTA